MRLSYEKVLAAPELPALTVLETALQAASFALAAAWPELHGADFTIAHEQPRAALEVIELARALCVALRRYRRTLDLSRREPDLPF